MINKVPHKIRQKIYIYSKGADHYTLSKFYQVADLYLHTSSYEGFGAVLAEASLSGLPVVSTKNDGCMDIIENKKSGFIVHITRKNRLYTIDALSIGGTARTFIVRLCSIGSIFLFLV